MADQNPVGAVLKPVSLDTRQLIKKRAKLVVNQSAKALGTNLPAKRFNDEKVLGDATNAGGYWVPNPQNTSTYYDLSIERPLEGVKQQLDMLAHMRMGSVGPRTEAHLQTLEQGTDDPRVHAMVQVIKGEKVEPLLDDTDRLGALVTAYNTECDTTPPRRQRDQPPMPGPPIIKDRDMTSSMSKTLWLRQVRRHASELRQVELVVHLAYAIRSRCGKRELPVLKEYLALAEKDSIVKKMVEMAFGLYDGMFGQKYNGDMAHHMKQALEENRKLRSIGVLLGSVCMCELAACSTSYHAMRYASKLSRNDALNFGTVSSLSSSTRVRSLKDIGSGARDFTYDIINATFQGHMKRIFRDLILRINDRRQGVVDDAMMDIVDRATNPAQLAEAEMRDIAALNICRVVTVYFRLLVNEGIPLKQLATTVIQYLKPAEVADVKSEGKKMRIGIIFPSLTVSRITVVERNRVMRALYAVHGFVLRKHPVDAGARGSMNSMNPASFFRVHAPLCVMLLDMAFTDSIVQYKHIRLTGVETTAEAPLVDNPGSVQAILELVPPNNKLQERCSQKLISKKTPLEVLGGLTECAESQKCNQGIRQILVEAGRVIYNAVMAREQFGKEQDPDAVLWHAMAADTRKTTFQKARGTNRQVGYRMTTTPGLRLPSTADGAGETALPSNQRISNMQTILERLKDA